MSCSEAEESDVLSVIFNLNLTAVAERQRRITASLSSCLLPLCHTAAINNHFSSKPLFLFLQESVVTNLKPTNTSS